MYESLWYEELDNYELGLSPQVLGMNLPLEFDLLVYSYGTPAVVHLANGDPGHPAEGPDYGLRLDTNLKKLLAAKVSNRVSDLLLPAIESWVEENFETLADDAYEKITQGE